MKVYIIRKTTAPVLGSSSDEILHNTVFSTESAAVKALKEDFDASNGPMSEPIHHDEKCMEMKIGDGMTVKWEVVEHDITDGKLG